MDSFGIQLKKRLLAEGGALRLTAVEDVAKWIDEEVVTKLESSMEEAVDRGEEEVSFFHRFKGGERVPVDDIEGLPVVSLLKSRCTLLDLDCVVMSHALLSTRDPSLYPCVEIRISLPSIAKTMHPEV